MFSSTNAYMLMYRRIEPTQRKTFVKQSEWSSSLKDLSKNILQDEHNEYNRREYEKNICKVSLLMVFIFNDPLFWKRNLK